MRKVSFAYITALAIGTGRAAYDAALKYAKEREQFGQPIGKFQAVQFKLVDMLATLEQARLYTYYAAALADGDQPITIEAALSKIIAADGCNEVCQKALNIFGGYGLMSEFPVQRYLRDSYFPMIGGDQRHHEDDRCPAAGVVTALYSNRISRNSSPGAAVRGSLSEL